MTGARLLVIPEVGTTPVVTAVTQEVYGRLRAEAVDMGWTIDALVAAIIQMWLDVDITKGIDIPPDEDEFPF